MMTPAVFCNIVFGLAHAGVTGLRFDPWNRPFQCSFSARASEKSHVFSYFCIVNTPGRPDSEIAALSARDDLLAKAEMMVLASKWPGFETICLYEGERAVAVVGNPRMGLATECLIEPTFAGPLATAA